MQFSLRSRVKLERLCRFAKGDSKAVAPQELIELYEKKTESLFKFR